MIKSLEEVKQTVNDIEILQDALEELNNTDGEDIIKNLIPIARMNIKLEKQTEVLLKESSIKMIEEAKRLLESEIGERMKKLNIHS